MLLVATAEASLHVTRWPWPVPYDYGEDEYYAVQAEINRSGPAEVCVVGSSRGRESVYMPLLIDLLHKGLGRAVTAGNYSTSGGRANDTAAVVEALMRATRPPKAIVYIISERDVTFHRTMYDRNALFWELPEWRSAYQRRGYDAIEDLPTVLRNEIGKYVYLIGRRDQVRVRLRHIAMRIDEVPSPARGGLTNWQIGSPEKKMRRDKGEFAKTVRQTRDIGTGPGGVDYNYPYPAQIEALERMARVAKAGGTRLVLVQAPAPDQWRAALPPNVYDDFLKGVAATSKASGVRFVRWADIGYKPAYTDFREHWHANAIGAKRFTQALLERSLIPAMKRDEAEARERAATRKRKAKRP